MSNPFVGNVVKDTGPPKDGDYAVPSEDTHIGALVALIDLGTHDESFQSEESKPRRKVLLVWELNEERPDGKGNFVVGKEYTASMHEKSALLQLAEALRGSKYKAGESADYVKMLGVNAAVPIMHTKSADGKYTYCKVDKIGTLVKGTPKFKPARTPFSFLIGSGAAIPTQDWLPRIFGKTIAEKIALSHEMRGTGAPAPAKVQPAEDHAQPTTEDEEIPF